MHHRTLGNKAQRRKVKVKDIYFLSKYTHHSIHYNNHVFYYITCTMEVLGYIVDSEDNISQRILYNFFLIHPESYNFKLKEKKLIEILQTGMFSNLKYIRRSTINNFHLFYYMFYRVDSPDYILHCSDKNYCNNQYKCSSQHQSSYRSIETLLLVQQY